jgi:hypothetical protein
VPTTAKTAFPPRVTLALAADPPDATPGAGILAVLGAANDMQSWTDPKGVGRERGSRRFADKESNRRANR